MGLVELLAIASIALAILISAPHLFGVDPLGQVLRWLQPAADTAPVEKIRTGAIESSLEGIDRDLKDLGEHIEAVRHLAEERGVEIERFREGYNFSVTRSLARGVIKAIDMVEDFRRQLEDTHGGEESRVLSDALTRLEATSGQLEMLLEANQIEAFRPEHGDSIEEHSQRFEPVEVRATTDTEQHGHVAEVKHPGWMLIRGNNDVRVIRAALVSVYGPAKEETDQ